MVSLKGSNNFGKKIKKDVEVECHINMCEEDITSKKVDVEIVDEEGENKFLAVSLKDDTEPSKEATIIISTNNLKRVLEAAEAAEISYEQRLSAVSKNFFLGTKEGVCPFCEEKKILLLLKGGITGCKSCLDTLAGILKGASEPTSKGKLFRTVRNKGGELHAKEK